MTAPTADRAGLLAHLVGRYSIPGHPAGYKVEPGPSAGQIRLNFRYWTAGKGGKVVEVRKVVTEATLEQAIAALRRKLPALTGSAEAVSGG